MKPVTRRLAHLDHLAIIVATACGLHCFCLPILLGISAIAGFVGRVSEPAEYLFLSSSFLLGTGNLLYSYRRKHHRGECLCMFCAGFFMVAIRDHVHVNSIAAVVGISGGTLVGMAHFRNLHLCRKAECCAEAQCTAGGQPAR